MCVKCCGIKTRAIEKTEHVFLKHLRAVVGEKGEPLEDDAAQLRDLHLLDNVEQLGRLLKGELGRAEAASVEIIDNRLDDFDRRRLQLKADRLRAPSIKQTCSLAVCFHVKMMCRVCEQRKYSSLLTSNYEHGHQ